MNPRGLVPRVRATGVVSASMACRLGLGALLIGSSAVLAEEYRAEPAHWSEATGKRGGEATGKRAAFPLAPTTDVGLQAASEDETNGDPFSPRAVRGDLPCLERQTIDKNGVLSGRALACDPDLSKDTPSPFLSDNPLGGIAFGRRARIGQNATAIGSHSYAAGQATALGNGAIAIGEESLALGSGAGTRAHRSTAIGEKARTTSPESIALGAFARAGRLTDEMEADWRAADATARGAVAIGAQSVAEDAYSVAVGYMARTTAQWQVMFGSELHSYTFAGLGGEHWKNFDADSAILTTDKKGNLSAVGYGSMLDRLKTDLVGLSPTDFESFRQRAEQAAASAEGHASVAARSADVAKSYAEKASDELLRAKRTDADIAKSPSGVSDQTYDRFLAAAGETVTETRRIADEANLAAGHSARSAEEAQQAATRSASSADRSEQAAVRSSNAATKARVSAEKADKALAGVVDATSGLQKRMASGEETFGALKQDVVTNANRLDSHGLQLDNHRQRLSDHENSMKEHDENLTHLNALVGTHTGRIDDHEIRILKVEKNREEAGALSAEGGEMLSHHHNTIAAHGATISEHGSRLQQHDGALATHDARLGEYQQRLGTHEGSLKEHRARLAGQESRLAGHDARLDEQQQRLGTHEGSLKEYRARLAGHDKHLRAQQSQLAAHDEKLEGHAGRLDDHQHRIGDVERKTRSIEVEGDGRISIGDDQNTYRLPGLSERASNEAQQGEISLVTSDAEGNLAALSPADFNDLVLRSAFGATDGQIHALQSGIDALSVRMEHLDHRMSRAEEGVAMALALASPLPDFDRIAFSASMGGFGGKQALAFSAGVRLLPNVVLSTGLGVGIQRGSVGYRIGLSWAM